MTEAVHRHGALAGIELWHGGACTMNRTSRLPPLSPSGMPWMATHVGFMGNLRPEPWISADIRDLLRVAGRSRRARRAMQAGFDIVYVYAGMGYLPMNSCCPNTTAHRRLRRLDREPGPVRARDCSK